MGHAEIFFLVEGEVIALGFSYHQEGSTMLSIGILGTAHSSLGYVASSHIAGSSEGEFCLGPETGKG